MTRIGGAGGLERRKEGGKIVVANSFIFCFVMFFV